MTQPKPSTAIVLAAGQGTRMKSQRAKVLHELAGRPMLHHVLHAVFEAGVDEAVVVVGHEASKVIGSLERFGARVRTALQDRQLGTGHAVGCALDALGDAEVALVLCGDTPLLTSDDLVRLRGALEAGGPQAQLSLLTCELDDPTGYGRILRDGAGKVRAIREHRDCSLEELAVREVNPAVYAVRVPFLRRAVTGLRPDNAQGELYFTDVVALAAAEGGAVGVAARDAGTLVGINDRAQLARAEARLHERIADRHRRAGVTIRASATIDAEVELGQDAVIEHHVVLRGRTAIGAGALIDVGSVLTDVVVDEGAVVLPHTVATRSRVRARAHVGPFSHLRPDSDIGEEAHVGNFVETKKTTLHRGAKANHLAYLGDGEVGEGANVGAGTIFCNYDGFAKHKTTIGKRAFIGSDSQLVAPVTIGDGAYVATGTTVTRDVPADGLAISRVKQDNKEGYASRLRARLEAASRTKK
jgi:bifunctional UDP-N-acetylglucosamine pyrophosphorylase/glucosamine-1-phosphate N-acetyltransferase